ncbi:MAG TPA: SRPBCC family protein, partial [Gemmatimonadales bacterium]|nr:SRPBCC family protein [Gemmatimonadales bacterium]
GAGLAYFLDPERGTARREHLAQRLGPLWEDAREALRSGASEPARAELMRYGARAGDLPGMGAVSLGPATGGYRSALADNSVLRIAGIVVGLYGLARRGPLGAVLRTVATGLLARAGGYGSGGAALGSDRRRAVDIQKTLYIEAPVQQVYAFWSNYENFPLFMSHVREVEDLGGGRSRWSVRGPGGVPIEWNARLTQQTPNELIAWRSEAGSMLENAGMIRFSSSGAGTRVDIRLCYHPPAGGAGQAVAELLGSDPRSKMNDDLGRMKALLEATTRSESHGQESQS